MLVAIYRARIVVVRVLALAAVLVASVVYLTWNGRAQHVASSGGGVRGQHIVYHGTIRRGEMHGELSGGFASSAREQRVAPRAPLAPPEPALVASFVGTCAAVAGAFGLLVASALAGNLSRERAHLALAWSRPRGRVAQALTVACIDVAAVGLVVVVVGVAVGVAAPVLYERVWNDATALAALGSVRSLLLGDPGATVRASAAAFGEVLGAAVMWYGVVACATAAFAKPAASWAAWPVVVALGVAASWAQVTSIADVLRAVNPLHYLVQAAGDPVARLATSGVSWTIGLAGIALAAVTWSRRPYAR